MKECARRLLQTLEDSVSDEGGGQSHDESTIGVPPSSRPCIPYPMVPYSMPSPATAMSTTATTSVPSSSPGHLSGEMGKHKCKSEGAAENTLAAPPWKC
eukprot:3211871-Pyramimonas_sp.AAC.1